MSGVPVMRPMWLEFPLEEALYADEEQFMLGEHLLVAPIMQAGATDRIVRLPGTEPWYDVEKAVPFASAQTLSVPAPLGRIPLFQRGGWLYPSIHRPPAPTEAPMTPL